MASPDKKPPRHLFSDLSRRMRRRREAGEQPPALPPETPPTPAVAPTETAAPLSGPAVTVRGSRHRRKTLAAGLLALYKRLARLFGRAEAGPLPSWSGKAFRAGAPSAAPAALLGKFGSLSASNPALWLGAALAAGLGAIGLSERRAPVERDPVAAELRLSASAGLSAREARTDALLMACREGVPGCSGPEREAGKGKDLQRLAVGGWVLPKGGQDGLKGILTPLEARRRYKKQDAVAGIGAYLAVPAQDDDSLKRTLIARAGGEPSPLGPAYDGRKTPPPDPAKGALRALAGRPPASVPPAEGYAAAGPGPYERVPKGLKGQDLVEAMIAESTDLEKQLKDYAKSGKWSKLKKVDKDFKPSMPDLPDDALSSSEAAAQLLETKRVSDRSMHCGECRPEDRVHDNRATYFGEPY